MKWYLATIGLLLLICLPLTAAEKAKSATITVDVGQTATIDVAGEPAFAGDKTISENLDLLRAWLKTLKLGTSAPDAATHTTEPDVGIKFQFSEAALVWDLTLKFQADSPGLYVVATSSGSEIDLYRIQVGPATPPPEPEPPTPEPPTPTTAPWEAPGLTVVILRESQTTGTLPTAQRAILTSMTLRNWIAKNCVRLEDGYCGFRVWDDDSSDLSQVPKVLQQAFPVVKAAMVGDAPLIGISNGKTGYVGPLPATVQDTITLLEQYK